MTGAPDLSIVIPVFNEPENIGPTLTGLLAAVQTPAEILVVYDYDQDTTLPVVRQLLPTMPAVRLHRNDIGRGVLNAMKAGIDAAQGRWVVITMADGSDDPAQVDEMVALARDGADLVAASRYMHGGHQLGGPRVKGLMSRAAGLSLHWIGGVPIHDPTSNYKLYSREFLDSVTIESSGGFELALELSVKATLDGRCLAEVPTVWRDRTAGQSNFRLRAWLPLYLHWYGHLFRARLARTARTPA